MRNKLLLVLLLEIIIFLTFTGCSGTRVEEELSITYSAEETERALDYALSRTGKPYVWGGNGPDEFDCSGLIVWAYQQVNTTAKFKIGNRYYRDAAMDDLHNYNTNFIPPADLRPGDIVFFTHDPDYITHGGLFIKWIDSNTFQFIHASSTPPREEVIIDHWEIGDNDYQWFAGAGRLIRYE